MANQSSYQKRKTELYILRYRIKTALQYLEHGKIEEAKNTLIGGLSKNESKNV